MYEAVSDPYCFPGTTVLKNIQGIRNQAALEELETFITAQRAEEPLPPGRLSVAHYKAIHHHLFQDIYGWAGRFRTVRIAKEGSMFCYPEHIAREMHDLFQGLRRKNFLKGLPPDAFVSEATKFLATLNAIHAFREGNGRTQTIFMALLADRAGYPFDLDRLAAAGFLAAMVKSFKGDDGPLAKMIRSLIA